METLFQNLTGTRGNIAEIGAMLYFQSGNEGFAFNQFYEQAHTPNLALLNQAALISITDQTEAAAFDQKVNAANRQLQVIEEYTGVRISIPQPVYAIVDPQTIELRVIDSYRINRGNIGTLENIPAIGFNQFTTIHVDALRKLAGFFPNIGLDTNGSAQLAELTELLNQKQNYVELLTMNQSEDLPTHTPTTIIGASELPDDAETFFTTIERAIGQQNKVMIKSAVEAGGEGCVIVTRENYEEKLTDLAQQLQEKNSNPKRAETIMRFGDTGIPLLVQPFIEPDISTGIPQGFGLNYYIHDNGEVEVIAATTQMYKDPSRKTHLGSYWSKQEQELIVNSIGEDKIKNLGALEHSVGYRGPTGTDGMNHHGRAELIMDSNRRLTAAFPLLAMREYLQAQAIDAEAIAHLGYNDTVTINNLRQTLSALDESELLFNVERQSGIFLLPSTLEPDNFTVYMVNLEKEKIAETFKALKSIVDASLIEQFYI